MRDVSEMVSLAAQREFSGYFIRRLQQSFNRRQCRNQADTEEVRDELLPLLQQRYPTLPLEVWLTLYGVAVEGYLHESCGQSTTKQYRRLMQNIAA